SVVSLSTMIATTSVLSFIAVVLLICVIVLWIKLVRARRSDKTTRQKSMPSSSSSVLNSSRYKLDRNSVKKETWENRKSKERRIKKKDKTEPST
ncbi:hypothetical protein PMAYCL1PPCAC_26700, partial [Pristionchus mayeri]